MTRREIPYHLVPAVTWVDHTKQNVFAPHVVYRGHLDLRFLAAQISLRSHMTEADVVAILQSFLTNAALFLLQSHAMRLGDLGYLTSAIRTDLVDKPDDYSHANIRKAHPVFVPSSFLKAQMRAITYRKVTEPEPEEVL